jgi:starch phosphorylase
LHTEILKNEELNNFYRIYPEKFNNKTNGITFRRWLLHCNPKLASLISALIGDDYKKDATKLLNLMGYVEDEDVLDELIAIKRDDKVRLADFLKKTQGVEINPDSIFDVQVKRLHEYKRQQMNVLYVIYKYMQIKEGHLPKTPITVIF